MRPPAAVAAAPALGVLCLCARVGGFAFINFDDDLHVCAKTGALWPSAWVAALFGVQPLQAESVARVSERKEPPSTTFALLTLAAFGRYARGPSVRHRVPLGRRSHSA